MDKDYIRYFYKSKEHRTTRILSVFNMSPFLQGWTVRLTEKYHGNVTKKPKVLEFEHFGDRETAVKCADATARELIQNGYKELFL